MISDTAFIANITRYRNYLERPNNWHKESMKTFPEMTLLRLLTGKYGHSGNFIYKIEVKQW